MILKKKVTGRNATLNYSAKITVELSLNVNKSLEHPARGKECQKHMYLLMCSSRSKTGHIYSACFTRHAHIVNWMLQSSVIVSQAHPYNQILQNHPYKSDDHDPGHI